MSPGSEAWLANTPRMYRPTEIVVPVIEGVGPVWDHVADRGGWYARLDVLPSLLDEPIAECVHVHPSIDGAWLCARALALDLADAATKR